MQDVQTGLAATWLDAEGRPLHGAPMGVLLSAQAERMRDATALIVGEQELTYIEMDRAANRLARHLAARGVGHGDRVVISMPNRAEYVQAMYAAWKLGAIPCPVSYRLVAAEFTTTVELCEPRCVVGDNTTHPCDCMFVNVDEPIGEGLSDAPLPPTVVTPGKIVPSGGSTGRPKLIIDPEPSAWGPDKASSHRRPGITIINAGPFYHSGPYNYCVLGLAEGSKIICMVKFETMEWLRLVELHRPDTANMVPTMMSRIAKLPEEITRAADLSSLRPIFHAAAPCPPDIKRWWIDRIGGENVLEVYGSTERIGSTAIFGDEWLEHPGSVGKAMPNEEIVILGEDGQPLPPGQIGEIYFRRPLLGPGTRYKYIGAESRIRGDLDSLGDLGWLDEDGYLYIADRRADMVSVGGMNVYPAEIEAAIETHPQVLCAAVIGLPDDDLGHRMHAIVELAEAVPVPEDGLAFLAAQFQKLSSYKRPRSVEFTHEKLRDDAGKVRRAALRDARLPHA